MDAQVVKNLMFLCFPGYGVYTTMKLQRSDFISDYVGHLISQDEAMALNDQMYINFFQLGKLKYR